MQTRTHLRQALPSQAVPATQDLLGRMEPRHSLGFPGVRFATPDITRHQEERLRVRSALAARILLVRQDASRALPARGRVQVAPPLSPHARSALPARGPMLLLPARTRASRALPASIPARLEQARTRASRALPGSGPVLLARRRREHARRALPARGPVLLAPAGTRASRALPASLPAQLAPARTHASRALQIITRPRRVLLRVPCA
jgi:hypothetical protein